MSCVAAFATGKTSTGTYDGAFTVSGNNDDCATLLISFVSSSQPANRAKIRVTQNGG